MVPGNEIDTNVTFSRELGLVESFEIIWITLPEAAKALSQRSTIGVRCVSTSAYFHWRRHNFGHVLRFFNVFKIFLVLIILYCLKVYCYIFDF